jgi:hypothetical protein
MIEERVDRLESNLKEAGRIAKILAETVLNHQGRLGSSEDRMDVIDRKIEILIDMQIRNETEMGEVQKALNKLVQGLNFRNGN